jgi:ArsR family transcriptional regulator, arsenate/arsenite/antimonite-responsive transcriptional repressor
MQKKQNRCVPESFPTSGNAEDDLGILCKALGHPARVKIMRILATNGTCISGDLASEVGLAPSTVSEHLRILKEGGLIQGAIDGPRRCYCINADTLRYWKTLQTELGL